MVQKMKYEFRNYTIASDDFKDKIQQRVRRLEYGNNIKPMDANDVGLSAMDK